MKVFGVSWNYESMIIVPPPYAEGEKPLNAKAAGGPGDDRPRLLMTDAAVRYRLEQRLKVQEDPIPRLLLMAW